MGYSIQSESDHTKTGIEATQSTSASLRNLVREVIVTEDTERIRMFFWCSLVVCDVWTGIG